jgi:UPF0716 family protein affecting phage T7 exclusion
MIKLLLLSAAILALADPYLLYCIGAEWGWWIAFAAWFGPVVLGNLLGTMARRNMAVPPQSPMEIPVRMAETFVLPFAQLAVLYPGPVSSVMGLFLLIGPFRRLLIQLSMGFLLRRRMGGAGMPPGIFSGMSGMGGPTPGGMGGAGSPFGGMNPNEILGGLKRAQGKVVESAPVKNNSKKLTDERDSLKSANRKTGQ